ncbi:alpha/beta fold hydrolase [Pseudonocardia charpentierae]|uniref:Alpha/beta hydrolase n=1 Tax=Pseudonocardia charpentierae TaxID=3075545 RepID=A0ABU2NKD1_9PSEU|nr:alpha/beta hydrolase [Pseudonocardia sp. DSM 45834]MDT0353064.1 alpha/beta hydrolase [Pseudonocardia sp. DSM 45834]
MALISVNDTTLYYELRGRGPALLFISGFTGDAGLWTEVAETLFDAYTVLTYDRRGNSRSPRPKNWTAAPIDQQADDAAELLTALDLAPAVAHGNSQGAVILTSLVLRHPEVLRAAIFHEPLYATATPSEDDVRLRQLIEEGMAKGGPPMAAELLLRWVAGDEVFESFDLSLRNRMLGNGEVFFGLELEALTEYRPTLEELSAVRLPCVVATGVENRDPEALRHIFYESSRWLADGLRAPLIETPGSHVPQASHPRALAETMRPILANLNR